MAPSRRSLRETVALTESPPDSLPANWSIARIVRNAGNNVYAVKYSATAPSDIGPNQETEKDQERDPNEGQQSRQDPNTDSEAPLVELPSRFRNKIWLRNGGFVVVDRGAFAGRGNKLSGEIVNVVREERTWMRMSYWPEEFKKKQSAIDSDEEDSNIGKMPPSPDMSDDDDQATST